MSYKKYHTDEDRKAARKKSWTKYNLANPKNMISWKNKNKEKAKQQSAKYRGNNPEKIILSTTKYRAKKLGMQFNLELQDIVIPPICPILGIPLFKECGKISPNSPSIDKIKPEFGYVKGNIMIISNKANKIKSDATFNDLIKVGEWAKIQQDVEDLKAQKSKD